MEIINKPFTMPEYNKIQFDRYIRMIEALISDEKASISYTGKVSYIAYCELKKLTLELLNRAYGNNHT